MAIEVTGGAERRVGILDQRLLVGLRFHPQHDDVVAALPGVRVDSVSGRGLRKYTNDVPPTWYTGLSFDPSAAVTWGIPDAISRTSSPRAGRASALPNGTETSNASGPGPVQTARYRRVPAGHRRPARDDLLAERGEGQPGEHERRHAERDADDSQALDDSGAEVGDRHPHSRKYEPHDVTDGAPRSWALPARRINV